MPTAPWSSLRRRAYPAFDSQAEPSRSTPPTPVTPPTVPEPPSSSGGKTSATSLPSPLAPSPLAAASPTTPCPKARPSRSTGYFSLLALVALAFFAIPVPRRSPRFLSWFPPPRRFLRSRCPSHHVDRQYQPRRWDAASSIGTHVFDDHHRPYLLRALSRNQCVLFVGAGFSSSAISRQGTPIPTAQELGRLLWDYAGLAARG